MLQICIWHFVPMKTTRMNKKKLFAATIVLFSAAAGDAQETGLIKKDTVLPLREVVVTAQRHQQENILVPYSVSTVTKRQAEEIGASTTPDLLADVNGVFVQKTNHGGGSPFIRGFTGNQALILVDGIRLNNATFRYGPNQYLNTIDPYTISRVEVAKGTGSVQYGTDAIGGVVHIITKEPEFSSEKSWNGKVFAKYMTGDMEKTVRGEAGYSGEKSAFNLGISKRSFGDLLGGDTTGKQFPSGYEEWALDAKSKFLLKQNLKLTLASQFLQQHDVPVFHKYQLENFALNEMNPQQRLLNYARLNIDGRSPLLKDIELTASWQQTIEGRNSRKNGNTVETRERDRINTLGFAVDIFSKIKRFWTANSGIELYNDRVNSSKYDFDIESQGTVNKRGLYPDDSRYGNYSIYSLHHLNFSRWVIDAGFRFNSFDIRITDTTLGKLKITPSALVVNLALLYRVADHQSLYAAFSSGYRAPNIDDMGTLGIVDFRYEVPAAGLEPEKSQHTEIGYKVQTSKFGASFAAYYIDLSNLITRVKTEEERSGYPVYQKENTEAAYVKGLEAELNWAVTGNFRVRGGGAYTYGQSLSKDEPLRRIPPFNGRATGIYKRRNWFAAAEFRFAVKQDRLAQGDKEDNRIPTGGTPGWQVLNFYGGYKLSQLQINAGLQNLFNEDYRMHGSGLNGVGRSGWLAVGLLF